MTARSKTAQALDCIEMQTSGTCEYSVIWLHGLGASGHDFEPIVPALGLLGRPGVRFVFPHAPVRPITVNGGASMRAWYDIDSMDIGQRNLDADGIRQSAGAIHLLVDREIERGVPAANITLAGFSQGGAIALYAGLVSPRRFGGILALSTYLPLAEEVLDGLDDDHKATPVFMGHGASDPVIQLHHAERSRDALTGSGVAVEWHIYPIAHSVSAEEVADISVWLKRQFGM